MVERLTITAMGRQRLHERIRDRIWTAIYNLPLNSTDERRADAAAEAIIVDGEYEEIPDHGSWMDKQ